MPTFDFYTHEQTDTYAVIEHNLGTENVLVTATQNGYFVQPSMHIVDENKIEVSAVPDPTGLATPIKITIVGFKEDEQPKETTRKSRGRASGGASGRKRGSENE